MGKLRRRLVRPGPPRASRRSFLPTLTTLEQRQVLTQVFSVISSPGAILSADRYQINPSLNPNLVGVSRDRFPVTATPNYIRPVGGLVPVTISGSFDAESPSIKRLDQTISVVNGIAVRTPASDDQAVLYVYPHRVTADFRVVDEYRQYEPRGPITLNRVPYVPPNVPNYSPSDPAFQKFKDTFTYEFNFVIYLPAARSRFVVDGRHYYVSINAEARDNGFSKVIQVDILHGPGTGTQTS